MRDPPRHPATPSPPATRRCHRGAANWARSNAWSLASREAVFAGPGLEGQPGWAQQGNMSACPFFDEDSATSFVTRQSETCEPNERKLHQGHKARSRLHLPRASLGTWRSRASRCTTCASECVRYTIIGLTQPPNWNWDPKSEQQMRSWAWCKHI